jgi:hypothetical protein
MKRPSGEFWELTDREISACIEQYLDERDEVNVRFGVVAAAVANCAGISRSHFYTAADFFAFREKHETSTSVVPASQRLREFDKATDMMNKVLGKG